MREPTRQTRILRIAAWLFWTSVVSLLTYGSLKRWRWAFWVYVVLLTAVVAESILGTNTTTIPLVSDLITGIIGAGLLIASAIGLFRFGPWAMKKVAPPLTRFRRS